MGTEPFRTARLIYRAPEPESEEDQDLFYRLQTEPTIFANSNASLNKPQSRKDAQEALKKIIEDRLLGVVICIAPDATDHDHTQQKHDKERETGQKAIPIGVIMLAKPPPSLEHHRFTELGIEIDSAYQGKGYGSEAIRWSLDWAFDTAGMHRVTLRSFEWNVGARRLYEKLGFRQEGIVREEIWSRGKWWDGYSYGLLEHEWRSMRADDRTGGGDKPGA